jgi:Mn-dependent DtxR family transcriptional regulator
MSDHSITSLIEKLEEAGPGSREFDGKIKLTKRAAREAAANDQGPA